MATSELSARDSWCTSQLRIVLLGGRNSGKNSVGNLILGKEEFATKEITSCSLRLALVAGRWLTVVDTPGWWCDFSAQDTSEVVKREIITSVSLCSPGPHVFLITVKASSAFSEKRRRAVEEHVALLGEKVWSHCILVFTSADRLQHAEAGECVARGGKGLQWLSKKCGGRCHSVISSDDAEVTQLLVKIQELVTENGNNVFEMPENILQKAAEEKRGLELRAQQRFMRMKQHRSLMQEKSRTVTDIRMVLLGAKGSGKTCALNTILGRDNIAECPRRTARCVVGRGRVFGRHVTVVDTPGWWMNYFCNESPIFDQRELVLSLSLCPPGPHVFLLLVRVDRAFPETYRRAAQEHLELISERIWSRVILLFSFGDCLGGTTPEQYIESEGAPLQWLVERCGNRYHVLNSRAKGDGFQVRELIGKIEEMMTGRNLHYEIERTVLERLEQGVTNEKERATKRLKKKEEQRQMARSQLEKVNPLTELRLVLVGGRKTGKSSCGNTILGRESFDTDTQTTSCSEQQGNTCGRAVAVRDTPGGYSVSSDLVADPCAILVVVNVSCSFGGAQRAALEEQLEAGGGRLWGRALVLFTHGDWLGDTSIEQRIESEGEPLRRLVEKCGNRYHVLDNKHRGDGAQVRDLIELTEEMLVGGRLAALHRGHNMWKSVSQRTDAMAPCHKELNALIRTGHQPVSRDLSDATPHPSLSCSAGSDAAQIVAVPAGGARGQAGFTIVDKELFMSYVASVLSGKHGPRWQTINVPVQFPAPHDHLALNDRVHPFPPGHQAVLVVSPETQHRALAEQDVISVRSLCHPALREQTLRMLSESGGLQALIDQWGNSDLEELEAFIDSYFETVWEQTMGSFQLTETDCHAADQDSLSVREVNQEEVLSSIDKKLSKLELLEEIKSDLAELRQSLEHSWRAIQDLKDKSKHS
ncbi:GTPase IMAP family member 8-like [Mugil cephalus]|uniref:GTPase IMAP family member 8-like n=1 Tax=Mugil cephalus TaxID=48193 RepID=UPI001FB85711|nr:GTPase IMAP family member 8-like [Mugil cephalus]